MASLSFGITPARSRALAIALLVLAVIVTLAAVLMPFVLLHRHYDQMIESLQDRMDRYQRVSAQAPELKKALDGMVAKEGRRFFLKNTAPNLAGVELQDLVRGAIENNGGRITTIQVAAIKDEGRFKQVGVNLQLFATTPNLQRILFALETSVPYMMVDNLTVRPLNAFRGFKPAPGAEPELSVLLDIVAYGYAEGEKK